MHKHVSTSRAPYCPATHCCGGKMADARCWACPELLRLCRCLGSSCLVGSCRRASNRLLLRQQRPGRGLPLRGQRRNARLLLRRRQGGQRHNAACSGTSRRGCRLRRSYWLGLLQYGGCAAAVAAGAGAAPAATASCA